MPLPVPDSAPLSQLAPFFIGTCRVHGPAEALRQRGHVVYSTPNRLHSPMQTLQFLEHLAGRQQFTPETVHLLSDFAMQHVVRGRRDSAWASLQRLRTPCRKADVFFIEISSLNEFPMKRPDGSVFYANHFTKRDLRRYGPELRVPLAGQEPPRTRLQRGLERAFGRPPWWPGESQGDARDAPPEIKSERLSPGQAIRIMSRIKRTLRSRPVVWLAHPHPPVGDPAHEHVIAVRRRLAETLREGAAALGDDFFDPSTVAAEMGTGRFFAKEGTDLAHFTEEAIERLADRYLELISVPSPGAAPGGPAAA